MKAYGRTSVAEFLGDMVVFRNLEPQDSRLPGLADIRAEIGLPAGRLPRKSEADYARVIVHLLQIARELDAPGSPIERLIFVGDTRLNDGTSFVNLCQVGEWPGLIFIGSENKRPAAVEFSVLPGGGKMFAANRWAALSDPAESGAAEVSFLQFCHQQGFQVDEQTAVVVDLDKTTLGARGRNAHVIDAARVQAVRQTVAGLLGEDFKAEAFREAYDRLNDPEFHPFTTDNQDYLAYICLILGSGLYRLDELIGQVNSGEMASFTSLIQQVEARRRDLPSDLAQIHEQVYTRVQAGDPTPFKVFRRNEYRTTIAHMGVLPGDAPLEHLLEEEILITQEVRALALEWRARGALLFGLSDKPDEASLPTPELAAQGYLPLHRAVTHAVGSDGL